MARLTDEQWEIVRMDYEVHGLSYSELADKHPTSKAAISRRANKEGWQQGRVEQIVQEKVNAHKALHEVEQKVERLVPLEQKSVEYEVATRLAQEQIFINSALRNQQKADEMLPFAVEMKDLNAHSQLTQRNKETVLGKQPDTAIQINNNTNGSSVIDELVAKRI